MFGYAGKKKRKLRNAGLKKIFKNVQICKKIIRKDVSYTKLKKIQKVLKYARIKKKS